MEQLFGRPAPDWTNRDSVVDYMTGSARVMSGSRGFDEQDVRAAAESVFDRAGRTAKAQRASHLGSMFAAIDCQPRWRERLGEITVPTLVVHGDEDPFFPHGNGVALAAEIPGVQLSRTLGRSHSATVRLAGGLRRDELVERQPGGDARSVALALTPAGAAAAGAVRRSRAAALDALVTALSGPEVARLEPLLERLLAASAADADSRRRTCRLCEESRCENGRRCPVDEATPRPGPASG